jgi:ribosomal-protein-alanine N-acetyltransferase
VADFPEVVRTERLILRRVEPADRATYVEVHTDPRTNRHHPVPAETTPQATGAAFDACLEHWAQDGVGYWAVSLADEPERVVGFTGVRLMPLAGRIVLNLAYRYRPEVWGRGYATEGARAAVEAAALALPDVPVVAKTTPSNVGSQRTALAVGLVRHEALDQQQDGWTDIYLSRGW